MPAQMLTPGLAATLMPNRAELVAAQRQNRRRARRVLQPDAISG
ncbi:MAG: hypothetical protein U0521_24980 [Anaerolineae bacterium]